MYKESPWQIFIIWSRWPKHMLHAPAGYGFVSFSDAVEGAKALREMNGKYIGNRPCKLRKSSWQERTPENTHKGKRKASDGAGNQPKKPGIHHK